MIRKVCFLISGCWACPNLSPIDGFSTHQNHCSLLNKTSKEYGEPTDEEDEDLQKWFSDFCTLEKVR